MIIQIDTNNFTARDSRLLAALSNGLGVENDAFEAGAIPADLGGDPRSAQHENNQTEKPATTRTRRTKVEIAFDEALATFQGPHKDDGSEIAALREAAEALHAKDPSNERLTQFAAIETTIRAAEIRTNEATDEEPATEDSESAEDSPLGEFEPVTIEQLTELASKLISSDRPAMIEVLKGFGVRRVSEVPEGKYGELAATIRTKLGK